MKRSPSRPSTVCNLLLGFVSTIHTATGVLVIAFQIVLIQVGSPYNDLSGGLWSGPVFFIQGVLGFVSLCDALMCSVVSFLVISIGSALLSIALAAVAAVDLGSVYKCPEDYYGGQIIYQAPYCALHLRGRILTAAWGIVISALIELFATVCSVYICMRLIYNSEPTPEAQRSNSYLYDEIPSPSQGHRFHGSLHQDSLQNVEEKANAFRKSRYSLNSTLPIRSKSVDKFSESSDSDVNMLTSTHSINIVPSGRKKSLPIQNGNSVYSMINPPNRFGNQVFRPKSTPSNLNTDMVYMKHTAV